MRRIGLAVIKVFLVLITLVMLGWGIKDNFRYAGNEEGSQPSPTKVAISYLIDTPSPQPTRRATSTAEMATVTFTLTPMSTVASTATPTMEIKPEITPTPFPRVSQPPTPTRVISAVHQTPTLTPVRTGQYSQPPLMGGIPGPTLSVMPVRANVESWTALRGSNFGVGERVQVQTGWPLSRAHWVQADEGGAISLSLYVPALSPGRYSVSLLNGSGKGAQSVLVVLP